MATAPTTARSQALNNATVQGEGWSNLDPSFRGNIQALINACGGRVWVVSGWRSHEKQTQLWNDALAHYGDPEIADNYVARPGGSNHEHGVAADLDGDLDCAAAHADQFGLTRPMDHEPWHFEPKGLRHNAGAYTSPPGGTAATPVPVNPVDSIAAGMRAALTGAAQPNNLTDISFAPPPAPSQSTADIAAGKVTGPALGGDALGRFMGAISGKESGGNANAVNADSGAAGTFQIMPGNWPSWAAEAGLGSNAPRTAANQQLVAQHKMQQYFDTYGDWGAVAAAWYGGPVAGQKYKANPNDPYLTRPQYSNGHRYPSISEYVHDVLGRMGPA